MLLLEPSHIISKSLDILVIIFDDWNQIFELGHVVLDKTVKVRIHTVDFNIILFYLAFDFAVFELLFVDVFLVGKYFFLELKFLFF